MSLATPDSATENSTNRDSIRLVDVHSLHKSGTMFLFNFFKHLSRVRDATMLSSNHSPASDYRSITDVQSLHSVSAGKQVVCRCPIRTFELKQFQVPDVNQHRIFHLRDPRDMIVSEYFSFGWIHADDDDLLEARRREIQQMSIDDYVIGQSEQSTWPLEKKYLPLINYNFDPQRETVVKYNQMVTNFPRWCAKVVAAYGFRFPKLLTLRLAWRYRNEFKTSAESMQHKRRITPGDFREKLKPETIKILNRRFEAVLERFEFPE